MHLLIYSLAVFLLAFGIHLVLWFVRVPRRPYPALLALFALAGLAAAALQPFLPAALAAFYPSGFWPWAAAALFHAAGSLSYIIVYSALEQDSPSVTMVKFTELGGPNGRARNDYNQILSDDLIIHSRLRAMVEGQLARRHGNRFTLAPKGAFWNRIFGLWMKLLGIRGGG